jgi:hypothetical protein
MELLTPAFHKFCSHHSHPCIFQRQKRYFYHHTYMNNEPRMQSTGRNESSPVALSGCGGGRLGKSRSRNGLFSRDIVRQRLMSHEWIIAHDGPVRDGCMNLGDRGFSGRKNGTELKDVLHDTTSDAQRSCTTLHRVACSHDAMHARFFRRRFLPRPVGS